MASVFSPPPHGIHVDEEFGTTDLSVATPTRASRNIITQNASAVKSGIKNSSLSSRKQVRSGSNLPQPCDLHRLCYLMPLIVELGSSVELINNRKRSTAAR